MKTYLKDFKEKFPNCRWSDKEIIKKHCRDDFYNADENILEDCRKVETYTDCKKCWNKEIRI